MRYIHMLAAVPFSLCVALNAPPAVAATAEIVLESMAQFDTASSRRRQSKRYRTTYTAPFGLGWLFATSGQASAKTRTPAVGRAASGSCAGHRVVATWYQSGRRTASGAPFNPSGYTAAHRTLPFGSRVTVTNPRNGQSVTVTINDRGPFNRGIALDLARGAARAIGMNGTQQVCMS
jgi:rare lipoprotein A